MADVYYKVAYERHEERSGEALRHERRLASLVAVANTVLTTWAPPPLRLASHAAFANTSSQSYNQIRLESFLRIRQLAITRPFPFIEDALKGCYLAYSRYAKFTSESTLPNITFLGNGVVELYSIDPDSSYQVRERERYILPYVAVESLIC